MKDLPTELFIYVISLLPLSSKLQCIRVSKNWNDCITKTNLYEQLKFEGSLHTFHQAIKYFKERRHIGERVRHLIMFQKYIDTEDILFLPTLFPNVQTIDWTECYNGVYCDLSKILTANKWCQLETLKYSPQLHPNMPCLFKYYVFPNLKQLEVNFGFNHDVLVVRSMVRKLLNHLHEAPIIDKLVMIRASTSLRDMEDIYSVLPTLKKVKLVQAYLSPEENEVSVDVQANQLESLDMEFFQECEKFGNETSNSDVVEATLMLTMSKWIAYVKRKFHNIQYLRMLHCREKNLNSNEEYSNIERALESRVCSMPNIKSCKIIF